ncbi:TolB family protein [Microlunatus sp. GCM10028923]|uniref:TolB family protein n=1 Tax=Microlunatus sp. GCM10028923 TaxID=3273400 RepID=UPI00360B394C
MSDVRFPRRSVLAGAGGLALTAAAGAGPATAKINAELPVRWLTDHTDRSFLTYPHHNGFLNGGAHLIIRYQDLAASQPEYLHLVDLATAARTPLPARPSGDQMGGGYFDVHAPTGTIFCVESPADPAVAPFRVWSFDAARFLADGTGSWQLRHTLPLNQRIADHLVAVHPDGTKIAFSVLTGTTPNWHSDITEITLATGAAEVLVSQDKLFNHVHYHPAFPTWLIFAHEGDVLTTSDRVWAHHRTYLPNGGNIVPQLTGTALRLAHERACHHDDSVVVINYANPRGLVRGHLDSRTPVQLADGRFEHCDISRDGRWIVVDTSDQAGIGTSIELIDTANGNLVIPIVTGIVRGQNHPRHNHPIFSPDGRYVLFNDPDPARPDDGGLRIGVVDLSGL